MTLWFSRKRIGGFHFAFAFSEKGVFYLGIDLRNEVQTPAKLLNLEMNSGAGQPVCEALVRELSEYLCGNRPRFSVSLDLIGTVFQKKVWGALMEIPYGETRSYKDIAEIIGLEKSARAVGQALGANPLPVLVPCHRVIRSTGGLGGFSSGLEVKKRLLELEREEDNKNRRRAR